MSGEYFGGSLMRGFGGARVWSRQSAVSTVLVVSLAVAASLGSGCAGMQSGAKPSKPLLGASSALPPDHRMADLSVADVRKAVASMRPAVVNGERGGIDWLQVQPDGSIIATGFSDGSWGSSTSEDADGRTVGTYTMGVEVPEQIGGLMVFHDISLTLADDTPVVFMGKALKVASLYDDNLAPDPSDYMFVARFTLEDGWVRATSIRYTSQTVRRNAWPDEFPPEGGAPDEPSPDGAMPAAQPGVPWLEVSLASNTPYQLVGYTNGSSTSSEKESGVVASADVAVPDRLGPVVVYHLAQVFYAKPNDAPAATDPDAENPPEHSLTKVPVRLQKAHYFGGPRLMGD